MSKLSKHELESALDALAIAVTAANAARNKIYDHCMTVYGFTPGEVDNDLFIDSCDGGCGDAGGMSAEAFDASMQSAIKMLLPAG